MRRRRSLALLVIGLVWSAMIALSGCSGSASTAGGTSPGGGTSGGPETMMGGRSGTTTGNNSGAGIYSSVGQRIWLTGAGGDGTVIPHTAPRTSQGALMMGGGGCASCHGADGKGGTIQMMMGPAIKAPDVTYASLEAAGYTDATIKRAIVDGLDEEGKPLDAAMPRWQMSNADVDAVIAYLKQLRV